MKIRSAAEVEDPAAGAEPSNRERRIKAGYRRLLRAVLDGKGGESKVQSQKCKVRHPKRGARAAEVYLSRFLCVGFVLALAVTGCVGPRPLKGGRAVTTRKPAAGVIEQTLVQGENPSQASKQDQETIKVRTYTVPAGSRIEQAQQPTAASPPLSTINSQTINLQPSTLDHPSTIASAAVDQPSTAFVLSAPMPVVEREETRARNRAWCGPERHGPRVGGQACQPEGHCLGGRWPIRIRPGIAGLSAPQGNHRQRDDQRGPDARWPGPHGPPQPDRRQRAPDPGRCRFSSRWLVPRPSPRSTPRHSRRHCAGAAEAQCPATSNQ